MYEVFFNHNRLIIANPDMGGFLNPDIEIFIDNDKGILTDTVNLFLGNQVKTMIIRGNPTSIWPLFRISFTEIPAAGGMVTSNNKYLFIFRKGKWDLPKGKIDNGETPEEAAFREVSEETGLKDFSIIHQLPSTWHIYYPKFEPPGSKPILKETKWFLMKAVPDQTLIPERGEEIEEVCWFAKPNLDIVLSNTYESLKNLIECLLNSKVI